MVESTGHNPDPRPIPEPRSPIPALGLYVHIPFCSSICNYCNFNRGLYDEALKTRYVAALGAEIAQAPAGLQADTIFFGGGTPSLLAPDEIGVDHRVPSRSLRSDRGRGSDARDQS